MILYAVDEFGGVLKSHANRQPLCLDLDATLGEIAIDIARTMTCGKDDGPTERELLAALNTLSLNAHDGVALKEETGHASEMMHLTATSQYRVAHVLDDTGQAVGANMRMGIAENIHRSPMLAEDIQNFFYITALLTACVEFAVGICSCPTLAITIVALGIHLLRLGNLG